MAVQDLVGLYETRSNPVIDPSSPRTRAKQDRRTSQNVPISSSHSSEPPQRALGLPTPTPARFVTHPLLRRREPSTADQEDDPVLPESSVSSGSTATYVPISTHDEDEGAVLAKETADADVTDEPLSVLGRQRSAFTTGSSWPLNSGWVNGRADAVYEPPIEMKGLLSGDTTGSSQTTLPAGPSSTRRDSLYHADSTSLASTSTVYKNPPMSSSTVTLVQPSRIIGPHTPIPLSRILARDAAPICLPKLDEYISSLEIPTFPITYSGKTGKTKGKGRHMAADLVVFPPLDRLEGTTIVDLENNAKISPAWRNRDTIFSSLSNVALGITVCPRSIWAMLRRSLSH